MFLKKLFSAVLLSLACALTVHAEIQRFHQLDQHLWHGSQPETDDDYQKLKALGVKTIVNLRWDKSVAESKLQAEKWGFTFINVPINAVKGPTGQDVETVMSALSKQATEPTYFHCSLGRDRTGLMAALYKVRYLGVDAETAYKEWRDLGFSNSFLRALDNFFKESTQFTDSNHIQGAGAAHAATCKKVAL
jgi:protein tyrosine/serine phosphatase